MPETAHNPATDFFLNLVVAFLAPMFLEAAGGNPEHARIAAIQTVNAYAAQTRADVLVVAQIVALGLATLASLSLSMTADLPVTLILRLRGNAASLTRAAASCRRSLTQPTPAPETAPEPIIDPEALRRQEQDAIASLARAEKTMQAVQQHHAKPASPQPTQHPEIPPRFPAPAPHAEPHQQQNNSIWATAMTQAAREYAASLPTLSPAERKQASMRIAALSSVAQHLLPGAAQPPSAATSSINAAPPGGSPVRPPKS